MRKLIKVIRHLVFSLNLIEKIHIETKKNYILIIIDFWKLRKTKGITILEYYDFELDKQSQLFRNSFLGLNEQREYLDLLNPKKYYIVARNKYFTHLFLENLTMAKSELYCYYNPEMNIENNKRIASDLLSTVNILKIKGIKQCVIKTDEGTHGDNVCVIQSIEYVENDCIMTQFNGNIIKLSDILKKKPLIFEGVVRQTRQFDSFNSSSVNTVRFMTTLFPNGEGKIIAIWLRIGREGKCIDNAGRGGNVDATIDILTGKIYNTVQFDGFRKTTNIINHPDNGNQIEGIIINKWDEIKEKVISLQKAIPFVKAAGWDIAITDDGPVVIEVNDFWDNTPQLFIRKGCREEIKDCYMAWKATGVSYPFERQLNKLSKKQLNKIINYDFKKN